MPDVFVARRRTHRRDRRKRHPASSMAEMQAPGDGGYHCATVFEKKAGEALMILALAAHTGSRLRRKVTDRRDLQ